MTGPALQQGTLNMHGACRPDPAAIETYVSLVLGYLEGTIAIRIFPEKGDPRASDKEFVRTHTRLPFLTTGLGLAKEILEHAKAAARDRLACFVIPGTTRGHGHAKGEDILSIQTVLADLDNGDIEAKRAHLIKWLGLPTLEVESGGVTEGGQNKLHLYWTLTEPAGGQDLAEAVRLRHVIALKIGDDPSFQRPAQPIRVAGSVHNKGPAKPAAIRAERATFEYELRDLSSLVAEMRAMPGLEESAKDAGFKKTVSEVFLEPVHERGVDGITRLDAVTKVIGYWVRLAREKRTTWKEAFEGVRS